MTGQREAGVELAIIVAMARNRVIGNDGQLPWHLPADLKRFKAITMGHPIIMGRKTHESIGRALPGRRNIVLTRQTQFDAGDCDCFASLPLALAALPDAEVAFIIGGAAVYEEALPRAARIYLTEVDAEVEGDVLFPPLVSSDWREVDAESHAADDKHAFDYRFTQLERVNR